MTHQVETNIGVMSQGEAIKLEILNTLEKGRCLDQSQVYTIVSEKLQVPRPTVRRITRDLIIDLQHKISILQKNKKYNKK